ncbi:MAG: PHP domain-containing protein [Syntrophomonadaceae bacterium]|nr:PHP domain-containing protein [Syntrophomonadaceae bacterium]
MYDLHVHSTASDGLVSPQEVVDEAWGLGLRGLAITDHDTVAGIEPAQEHLRQRGYALDLVPAIELNAELGPNEVHILGYFIDPACPPLLGRLQEIKEARRQRAVSMVEKLNRLGYRVSLDRVRELAGGDVMGRPHIGRALVEQGYVASLSEAFARLIGMGKPAYVPRYKFVPAEAVQMVRRAGGVPVLAHPGLLGNDVLVEELLELGIEGLEVYYPEHSPQEVERYLRLARRRRLLVTGGSDYHGAVLHYRGGLGSVVVGDEVVASLRERAAAVEGRADAWLGEGG